MIFFRFAYIVFILLSFSCNNEERAQKADVKKSNADDSLINDEIIRKFSLPYPPSLFVDSTALLFYALKEFDTSFVLHCSATRNEIVGIYYYVVPRYRGLYHFRDPKREVILFQGLSFKIDGQQWEVLKNNASKIINRTDTAFNTYPCYDCPFYFISHDGKWSNTIIQKRELFEIFSINSKDPLINKYLHLQK